MTNRQKVYTHCDSVLVLTALINHTYMQVQQSAMYMTMTVTQPLVSQQSLLNLCCLTEMKLSSSLGHKL